MPIGISAEFGGAVIRLDIQDGDGAMNYYNLAAEVPPATRPPKKSRQPDKCTETARHNINTRQCSISWLHLRVEGQ